MKKKRSNSRSNNQPRHRLILAQRRMGNCWSSHREEDDEPCGVWPVGQVHLSQRRATRAFGLCCWLPFDVVRAILENIPCSPDFDVLASGAAPRMSFYCSMKGRSTLVGAIKQICFGPEGTLWACDFDNHRILETSTSGVVSREIGEGQGTEHGQLNYPIGIAV